MFISIRSISRGAFIVPEHSKDSDFLVVDVVDTDMFLRIRAMYPNSLWYGSNETTTCLATCTPRRTHLHITGSRGQKGRSTLPLWDPQTLGGPLLESSLCVYTMSGLVIFYLFVSGVRPLWFVTMNPHLHQPRLPSIPPPAHWHSTSTNRRNPLSNTLNKLAPPEVPPKPVNYEKKVSHCHYRFPVKMPKSNLPHRLRLFKIRQALCDTKECPFSVR